VLDPALVARLRATEARRRELRAQLERLRTPLSRPAWRELEQRMRQRLTDWRSLLTGDDVVQARQGFRQLLAAPIQFTPFVDERGYRAIRFEGRWGLEAVFGGVVCPSREKGNTSFRRHG
jgi:hypothetical protein